ncbi:MAG TPA: hypothetical protein VMG59_08020 [Phycisphaerae bacterium]|nr:hypothetical protein [Phycisphaerae bacterium]
MKRTKKNPNEVFSYSFQIYYRKGQTRRTLLKNLERLAAKGTIDLSDVIKTKSCVKSSTTDLKKLEAAFERIRNKLFEPKWLEELKRTGRDKLDPKIIKAFMRPVEILHIANISSKTLGNFSLKLAPKNKMLVISSEMWLDRMLVVIGGVVDVVISKSSNRESIRKKFKRALGIR